VTTTQVRPTTGNSDNAEPLGRGSLLRAEVHRFLSRRFVQVLVLLSMAGLLAAAGIAGTQYADPSPEALASAQASMDEQLEMDRQFHEECLAQPNPPEPVENLCGPPPDGSGYELSWFIDKTPFTWDDAGQAGATAVGVAAAAVLFLIGATYVGAEWSARSMVALLFWETRRLKVVATKAAVVVLAGVVLGLLAQALWLGAAAVLTSTRGTTDVPAGFWGDFLAMQGRAVLLAVLAGLLGFGLANLIRNTGAALGVAFVYFAVLETAVRVLRPAWDQFLVTTSAAALVNPGGVSIWIYGDQTFGPNGEVVDGSREIVVSNLHGGLVLGGVCLLVVAVGTVLFQRRDLH
jgi:hypothetical protein